MVSSTTLDVELTLTMVSSLSDMDLRMDKNTSLLRTPGVLAGETMDTSKLPTMEKKEMPVSAVLPLNHHTQLWLEIDLKQLFKLIPNNSSKIIHSYSASFFNSIILSISPLLNLIFIFSVDEHFLSDFYPISHDSFSFSN